MHRSVLLSLLPALAWGCTSTTAAPPAPEPTPRFEETSTGLNIRLGNEVSRAETEVRATAERVWAVLPEVYRELGIPAEVSDSTTGTYGSRHVTVNRIGGRRTSSWLRCGNDGAGASAMSAFRYRLTVLSTVRPGPGARSLVTTEVSGTGTTVEGTSTGPVRCVSTGDLEQRMAEMISAKVAGR